MRMRILKRVMPVVILSLAAGCAHKQMARQRATGKTPNTMYSATPHSTEPATMPAESAAAQGSVDMPAATSEPTVAAAPVTQPATQPEATIQALPSTQASASTEPATQASSG